MSKRALAGLVVVILALAVAVFFWQRSRRDAGGNGPESTSGAAQAPPSAKRMPGSGAEDRTAIQQPPPISMDDDPEGTLRLEGQVLDSQERPVGGAVVTINSNPGRTATSEEDGSFFFDKLIGRSYAIRARSGNEIGGPVMHKLTAKSDPVVVRLHPGATVIVTVVASGKGEPIAGATVQLRSGHLQTEVTNADGNATFAGVPSGFLALVAAAPGYGPTHQPLQVPDTAEARVTARVLLQPGTSVAGRVLDPRGKPVSNARVLASDVSKLVALESERLDAATTDAKGGFTITALSAGTYRLTARHEDFAPTKSEPISVDGATPVQDIVIQLEEGGTLAGKVVDRNGQPSPWAGVRTGENTEGIGGGVGGTGGVLRQATADEDGTFVMKGLPRTSLSVIAIAEQASSEIVKADLTTKAKIEDLVLSLSVDGLIAGKVVSPSGEPVAEAQVTALPDVFGGSGVPAGIALRGMSAETTDGGGRFEFRGLPEGTYRLRTARSDVSARAFLQPGKKAATGDTDVELVLEDNGGVKGRLLFKDGTAAEVFTVAVAAPPGIPFATSDGAFEVPAIPPGTFDITFRGPDFGEVTRRDVEVKAGVTTDMGTIKVPRGRFVTGRVVDGNGAPVADATVVVARQIIGDGKSVTANLGGGVEEFMNVRRDQTDENGGFRVRGISTTAEAVIVAEHLARGRSLPETIPPGEDDPTYRLVIRPFGSVAGTLTVGGQPGKNLNVVVTPKGARAHNLVVNTSQDGTFVLEHVPAGEHLVMGMSQGGLSGTYASANVTVGGGKRTKVNLNIEIGEITLEVLIKGAGGVPIDLAQTFLFKGALAPRNGKEVQEAFLSAGTAGGAKMTISLGGAPSKFEQVSPGEYSVCTIPINGNMNDPSFQVRLQKHVESLKVYCKRHTVSSTPSKQTFSQEVPPMDPLPEEPAAEK